MNNRVLHTLRNKCRVCAKDKIIVALSGGADSVTLLDVLIRISESGFPLEISAAHVNHNLRGEESLRDETFVRNLCECRGIELFVKSVDVKDLAQLRGESIELCARNVRYDFFSELSHKYNAKIATAHTLSDSEETMLYNIARGTTLHGLTSIPYVRNEVVRPLLDITRAQVEDYCSLNKLEFVTDSTNLDESMCSRNKIRHSVLPPLKSINDGFDHNFYKLRDNLLLADDYLKESAQKAVMECKAEFGYSAEKLLSLHPALLRYTLAIIIENAGAKAENRHILLCEAMLENFGAVVLPGGFTAVSTQGIFRVLKLEENENFSDIPFADGLKFVYNNKVYSTELFDNKNNIYKKFASSCIACDKISGNTVIRRRREGDNFSPLFRGVTKPLRKLQNELKVPKEKREDSLVVADGSVILWAEHIGVSAQGAMTEESPQGINIQIIKGED